MVRGTRWGSIGLPVEVPSSSSNLGVLSHTDWRLSVVVIGTAMFLGMASLSGHRVAPCSVYKVVNGLPGDKRMESAGSNVPDLRRENFVSPFGDSLIVRWDNPSIVYHPRPEDLGTGSVPDDVVLELLADRNRVLYERDKNECEDWTMILQQKDLIYEQSDEIRCLKRQLEDTKAEYKAYKRTTWEKLRRILSLTSEVTDVTWSAIGTRVEIIGGSGETSKARKARTRPTTETQVPEPPPVDHPDANQADHPEPQASGAADMRPLLATLQQFFQYTQGQTPQATAIPATDQALERFLRFQPPKFLGEPDDYKAESWLDEIEKIFKVLRYDDEQKILFSTFRFEEAAHNWWRVVEARWQREEIPHTWVNFVKEFNDKFVPQVVRDRREQEFVSLIQGSCTVAQYEAKFNKLIKYAPYMLDDELRRTKKFYVAYALTSKGVFYLVV
ncbi:UNVERIFIED_CONTAM: hypothetical protein Sradi_7236900 [Sesamum radiatum]|uniref:Retrotransposon gag domain-containing protein n=1 Tax=Sesamum radiatum TaxID=300843 RepID=A0AAW2IM40_SESRA